MTPLEEGSDRCRHIYLTKRYTQKSQTTTPPPRFERAIPASDHQQTLALDRSASDIIYTYKIQPMAVQKITCSGAETVTTTACTSFTAVSILRSCIKELLILFFSNSSNSSNSKRQYTKFCIR